MYGHLENDRNLYSVFLSQNSENRSQNYRNLRYLGSLALLNGHYIAIGSNLHMSTVNVFTKCVETMV